MSPRKNDTAFTLIELSIVLVIIGLIVGGILVGRDLIESANMRATASQLQQISSAVNTFKVKYDSLPGDIPALKAQSFGLRYGNNPGISGTGDDNGNYFCNDSPFCPGGYSGFVSNEVAYFFIQLGDARLLPGSYNAPASPMTAGINFPSLKMDASNGVLPFSSINLDGNWLSLNCNIGPNFWTSWMSQVCSITLTASDTGYSHLPDKRFTPKLAYALDAKLDDGKRGSGTVRAIKTQGNPLAGNATNDDFPGVCVTDSASTAYNITSTSPVCSLAYKF